MEQEWAAYSFNYPLVYMKSSVKVYSEVYFKTLSDIYDGDFLRKYPAGIYLLKVNNKNASTRCKICSKLTIKTPERRQWRSGVFIVNFEYISHLVLVFLLLTLNMQLPARS